MTDRGILLDFRGEAQITRQFFLAEVQRFEQLREQDDLSPLPGRLPDEPFRPFDIHLPIFTAFHLGCSDLDLSHHKPPARAVSIRAGCNTHFIDIYR
jgi:hypothetical protein